MSEPLAIDVWSDIACPWCWVGKRNLEKALEHHSGEVDLRWHAFELNPEAPNEVPEGFDYVGRLATKYDTDRDGAMQMVNKMVKAGADVGLDLRFDHIRPSNTFDGHRLMAWATDTSNPATATALKERLFQAYLKEGRVVADHETLCDMARESGLDRDEARAILLGDDYSKHVRGDQEMAQRLGVTGVPFFVLGAKVAVSGAQPPKILLDGIKQALTPDED